MGALPSSVHTDIHTHIYTHTYLFVSCFIIHSWNVDSAVLCLVNQLCPSLGDPVDGSPPGSSVHGDSPGKNTGEGQLGNWESWV